MRPNVLQETLFAPPPVKPGTALVNDRVSVLTSEGHRVVCVDGLVVHHYLVGDRMAEIYAMVMLVESGYAYQNDVARVFGYAEFRPGQRHIIDAALAVWHMLGQAMLARLAANEEQPCMRAAKLTRKVASSAGLAELVPVRCEGLFASPLASGYAPVSALAQANGWILVPAGSEGYQAHSEVMIRPWP